MQIVNYTITDGKYKYIAPNLTSVYQEVVESNFTKYLTTSPGLQNIFSHVNFEEMRFYCTTDVPGRTIHLRLIPSSQTSQIITYMKDQSYSLGDPKLVTELYSDDTAFLSRDRLRWGQMSSQMTGGNKFHQGYFGYYDQIQYALYVKVMHVEGENEWTMGYNDKMLCDQKENDPEMKFGNWRIYVR